MTAEGNRLNARAAVRHGLDAVSMFDIDSESPDTVSMLAPYNY